MGDHLENERFLNLQTFRTSGEPVATTVWFAGTSDGFVFGTHRDSGKVRRLRRTASVRYAPANFRGLERSEYEDGVATLLEAEADVADAEAALAGKYGWQWTSFSRTIDCYVRVDPA